MSVKNKLLVVSGPSGVGKGTLLSALLKDMPDICFSISATTRSPREGEQHGKEYFFLTKAEFEDMIVRQDLLEYAYVHENYYGTPREFVNIKTIQGFDVLLEIDVQGALQIKKQMPEAILIFIAPPNLKELENRLKNRGQDSSESIKKRLKVAETEINQQSAYDYLVVNNYLDEALLKLKSIVIAERCKISK